MSVWTKQTQFLHQTVPTISLNYWDTHVIDYTIMYQNQIFRIMVVVKKAKNKKIFWKNLSMFKKIWYCINDIFIRFMVHHYNPAHCHKTVQLKRHMFIVYSVYI